MQTATVSVLAVTRSPAPRCMPQCMAALAAFSRPSAAMKVWAMPVGQAVAATISFGAAAATGAAAAAATTGTPGNTVIPGAVSGQTMYVTDLTGAVPFTLSAQSIGQAGATQPHENCMPTLSVQYCIAWAGIFPSQA